MEDLLFLVHRIPYPPNKGDKIRSYHFLRLLSQHYKIHLGAFVDDPDDWAYVQYVEDMCESVHLVDLQPTRRKLKSLIGLLKGEALGIPYYDHRSMRQWVRQTLAGEPIKKVLVFSSTMAQYVLDEPELDKYIDFVDVDSDKWRQYAEKKRWPASMIYQREADKLLSYERQVVAQSRGSVLVSGQEAELFRSFAPEFADRIGFIPNGVDTDFFSPEHAFESPYANGAPVLVFTGAMDYWANVDAVVWFAQDVLPLIRAKEAMAEFVIVGSKPSSEVEELAALPGVTVTGRVEDVRPYLAHANIVVAPLRVARGVQNKVLEGLAMDKPVMATQAAMEGITMGMGMDVGVHDEPQALANAVLARLDDASMLPSGSNRQHVIDEFSWTHSGLELVDLLSR